MKTLIIDNYDSFTFNLYQLIAEVTGDPPCVLRNDSLSWEELSRYDFDNIVISPGPGSAENERDFGVCARLLKEGRLPVLGVCLGHQGIGCASGGEIGPAPEVMHGRISIIHHNGSNLFKNIPGSFRAVRYHSLIIKEPLPGELEKTAWTDDGIIMGIQHKWKPCWGVQFHPESICSEYGRELIANFMELSDQWKNGMKISGDVFEEKALNIVPRPREKKNQPDQYKVHICPLDFFPPPERTFHHLFRNNPRALWLDSSKVIKTYSRYSYMGGEDGPLFQTIAYDRQQEQITIIKGKERTVMKESVFDYLERELEARKSREPSPFPFNGGFAGFLGYELKNEKPDQGYREETPGALFFFMDRLIIHDLEDKKAYLLCITLKEDDPVPWFEETTGKLRALGSLPPREPLPRGIEFRLDRDYRTYLEDIARCKEFINAGESYEICLTNKFRGRGRVDPYHYYRRLREVNPAPYSAFLRFDDIAVACSSPERFLQISPEGDIDARPMKGTLPRGGDKKEDENLRRQLAESEKERSENLMICDLLRNDLGMVCETGSIHVPGLMVVESYATVHQMISIIRGKLRSELGAIAGVKHAFPGGSMTGAPKIRTMKIIDFLEKRARGIYSGALGFFALNGSADFNIVIRSAVFQGETISLGVGGAITALSDPEKEFEEMRLKGRALLDLFKPESIA